MLGPSLRMQKELEYPTPPPPWGAIELKFGLNVLVRKESLLIHRQGVSLDILI